MSQTQQPKGTAIHFKILSEEMSYYDTMDGYVIAVKTSMGKLLKVAEKDSGGHPIFQPFPSFTTFCYTKEEFNQMLTNKIQKEKRE